MADKVLVVDDDKAILTMLHKALKSNGIENDLAISGEAALELLETNSYDLILLDINMRGINGFEVIQRIRSKGLTTPVMVVSGRKEDQDALYGLEIGADDYIGKPFGTRELLARMKNVMRRAQKTSPLLRCGNVTIDPIKGIVRKNGSEIAMSALEYRLLLVFFSNKNQLLSRDRLAEELWSLTKEFISDNTLSVYIRRLREKIETEPQDPHIIVTVRGLGYKAVDE